MNIHEHQRFGRSIEYFWTLTHTIHIPFLYLIFCEIWSWLILTPDFNGMNFGWTPYFWFTHETEEPVRSDDPSSIAHLEFKIERLTEEWLPCYTRKQGETFLHHIHFNPLIFHFAKQELMDHDGSSHFVDLACMTLCVPSCSVQCGMSHGRVYPVGSLLVSFPKAVRFN